jgi:hypothetical protein
VQVRVTLKELESARVSMVLSDETKRDECALHMSNITTLPDEYDVLQSISSLLGVCQTCSGLQTKLAKKNARIASIEKARTISAPIFT